MLLLFQCFIFQIPKLSAAIPKRQPLNFNCYRRCNIAPLNYALVSRGSAIMKLLWLLLVCCPQTVLGVVGVARRGDDNDGNGNGGNWQRNKGNDIVQITPNTYNTCFCFEFRVEGFRVLGLYRSSRLRG